MALLIHATPHFHRVLSDTWPAPPTPCAPALPYSDAQRDSLRYWKVALVGTPAIGRTCLTRLVHLARYCQQLVTFVRTDAVLISRVDHSYKGGLVTSSRAPCV